MVDQYENYEDEVKEEPILNVTIGDQPSPDDLLGFTPHVEAIKEFLINPYTKPPLTLSIEGPWGSGKSSFILQLKKKLENNGEYTVLFSSWRHDKGDTMWAAFALEFIRQLSKNLTLLNYIRAELNLYRLRIFGSNKRYDRLKIKAVLIFVTGYTVLLIIGYILYSYINFNWINSSSTILMVVSFLGIGAPIYIPILSVVPNLKKLLGDSVSNLKKYIKKPDYENHTTFIEEFHEDFKNIVECYAQGKKVFVFIDDLDRCEVPKAADLMQALNLMISNDPRLIFIVGMDRLKVASGFAVKYEKLLPYLQSSRRNCETSSVQNENYYKGLEYGYEFLEKFIQLPFSVPQSKKSELEKLVFTGSKKNIIPGVKASLNSETGKKNYKKEGKFFEKIKYLGKKEKGTSFAQNDPDIDKRDNIKDRKNTNVPDSAKLNEQDETKRKFNENIKIVIKPNSIIVRKIVRMVLPALDYNPRRIKQFTNLFRLKAFIALETGLLFPDENDPSEKPLSLQKLGKLVAITLKWPLIVSELASNRKLLDELQEISLTTSGNIENIKDEEEYWATQEKIIDLASDEAKYWVTQKNLVDLLRYGYFEKGHSINEDFENIYSLSKLKIDKLLQTSQRIDKTNILSVSDKNKRILEINFQKVEDKEKAWNALYALTTDMDDLLRYVAVKKCLESAFLYMTDKQKAWDDLHKLTTNEDLRVRFVFAKFLGSSFSGIPDKQQACEDAIKLSTDENSSIRVYANYSLGRVSIFRASQAEKEEDYKNELEKAIMFFEKASKESSEGFNPAKFCLPFYRSFYTIIFQKYESKGEVENYLIESKVAIEGSKRKELLFEAVNNLANTLKEIQNLQNLDFQEMRNELSSYRKYCDHAAELLKDVEDDAPFAAGAVRRGLPILDRNLKGIIEEIQEKAKVVCKNSQGTDAEEIACAVNREVQKWEIGSQEYLETQIESLVDLLKSYIPNTEENSSILNKTDIILQETDIVKQYRLLNNLIPQVLNIQVSSEIKELIDSVDRLVGSIDELQNPQEFLDIMQRNLEEIKNDTPEMKEKIDEVLYELYSPLSTTQKLKVAIPIIPSLVSYEIETDVPKLVAVKIHELKDLVLKLKNK